MILAGSLLYIGNMGLIYCECYELTYVLCTHQFYDPKIPLTPVLERIVSLEGVTMHSVCALLAIKENVILQCCICHTPHIINQAILTG